MAVAWPVRGRGVVGRAMPSVGRLWVAAMRWASSHFGVAFGAAEVPHPGRPPAGEGRAQGGHVVDVGRVAAGGVVKRHRQLVGQGVCDVGDQGFLGVSTGP